ncbi:28_t:CDS:2, partial [Dentiscutata erythropus]
ELGSTSQHLEHSDRFIHITTFSPNTTTIFKSDTEQQFYQSAEVSKEITNIYFPTLTTESSFSSNSTDLLEADFLTPAYSSIIPPTNLINRESDTDSIDELQENLFDNNNNQVEYIPIYPTISNTSIVNYWEADQPQDNIEIDSWNSATDLQF